MSEDLVDLLSASEAEQEFGAKLFYRQRVYRLAANGQIKEFSYKGSKCYPGYQILENVIDDLEVKIKTQIPALRAADLAVVYDPVRRVVIVDGLGNEGVVCSADECSEEDIVACVKAKVSIQSKPSNKVLTVGKPSERLPASLSNALPTDIEWVQLTVSEVAGVDVRSMLLLNLSTIADFVGVRSRSLSRWMQDATFKDAILSISHKQIQEAQHGASWKRGVVHGLTSYLPFELLPELLVAFKNTNFKVSYPAKANMLYEISSEALKAVGLAVSGNKDKAAEALAEVGKGLGLDAADQIIGIMRTYSSRDFQVKTHREFTSTVTQLGGNYGIVTGRLTLGITGKTATDWLREGKQHGLKSKQRTSAREVMRAVSPGNSIGMAFGERHYTNQPNESEAIKTGIQGKSFYERLQSVGLLD